MTKIVLSVAVSTLAVWAGLVAWAVRTAPIATDPDGYAD